MPAFGLQSYIARECKGTHWSCIFFCRMMKHQHSQQMWIRGNPSGWGKTQLIAQLPGEIFRCKHSKTKTCELFWGEGEHPKNSRWANCRIKCQDPGSRETLCQIWQWSSLLGGSVTDFESKFVHNKIIDISSPVCYFCLIIHLKEYIWSIIQREEAWNGSH